MAKLNLPDIGTLANSAAARQAINDNFTAIETAMENTLSRDGTLPNQMEADLDMDGNDILNVGIVDAQLIYINGVPIGQSFVYGTVAYNVFTADGLMLDFPLSTNPGSLGNLDVSIDGITQVNGEDFTFTDNILQFASAPPAASRVLVRFAVALAQGTGDADSTFYTPPQTGILSTVKDFLDSLWEAGTSTGGALIRYIQAGVNAVAYNLQDKARERVNVFDYMTFTQKVQVQLGTGDMTNALQAAAAACTTLGHDSHLHFHKGIYNVSAETLIQFSGIVSGAGTHDTVIRPTVNNINVFNTEDGFGQVVFRDFNIIPTVPMVAGAGIYLGTVLPASGAQQLARIQNVRFQNLYRGVEVRNAAYFVIRDCAFFDCIIAAIEADCTSNFDAGDNTIDGCLITGLASGSGIRLFNNCRVINNKILGHVVGIFIEPSAAPGTRVDYQIIGNSIENFATHGVLMRVTDPATGIANSIIGQNQLGPFAASAQCIAINGPVGGLSINNNLCVLGALNQVGIAMVGNGAGAPGTINVNGNVITGGSAGTIGIFAGGGGVVLDNNLIPSASTRYSITAAGNTIRNTDATFAEITAWAAGGIANGSIVYCSDGTIANPVAGAGTGCIAKRLNGVWVGN